MPEAVIVATARTPIGRAVKGSLAEARPDDTLDDLLKRADLAMYRAKRAGGDRVELAAAG